MPRATDGTLLPDDEWNELQSYADRFAETRQKGPVDDWEPLLPPAGHPLRRPVLIEVAKIDIEMTWREGGRALVETYETLYPELHPIPLELIVEEYRTRHREGDQPPLDSYQVRFPDRFAEIEKRAREQPPQQSAPTFQQPATELVQEAPTASLPAQGVFPPGYTPIARIGRGNFAEVWRAEAPGGIEVAVKIVSQPLDNDAAKQELKALELVKKLQHPTLLSTLAFWVIQNRLVIVMELADITLRDRLKECQAEGLPGIPPDELLLYFRDAAEGLDWLHWQGVLHRDIKPENILLKKNYAKVADFGLAKSGPFDVMVSASFAGTPAFMAPEVWGRKAGKESDQYSLAFTYAELRMGRRPLEGGDFMQVMNSALNGTPNLEGLPELEQTALRRALSKKPEERFGSCQDFVEALERALVPAGRASRRRPTPTTARVSARAELAPTERTDRPIAAPKPNSDISEGTLQYEPSVPKAPVVWKPPGPKPAAGSSAKPILIVLVGLIVLGGGGVAAYIFWPDSNRQRPSTTETTTVSTTRSTLTTRQLEPGLEVPSSFAAVGNESAMVGSKSYAKRIAFRRGLDGETVLRLLQPPTGPPFYVAENKVTNATFAAFLQESPGGKTGWTNDGPMLPAVNVTLAEAEACARWMKGELPTPEQLDFAGGFEHREGRSGPAKPGGRGIGVKVAKPLPVDREHNDDVSPLDIRDLSGNGREWTRARLGEFAVLRGRMYTLSTPLSFIDLEAQRDPRGTQTQRPSVASPYTGFRVVIEIK